ncbi:type 2 isopentenyl-diphosphate Delta-isomerase [Eupransor demetentiae]|uniref:Isopentenyl-diphosphate delta-isomerase n=1 Tax=Eupransor demetentiae TaxID=3109584 RepID=A0ABP0ESC6_9LACO|nr:FMN-dependent dehydrogenase [Lactobacillaceae bacterium LMG 33000]
MTSQQSQRKKEHLSLATKAWKDHTNPEIGARFDRVRWLPNTLPELALDQVDTSTELAGIKQNWPFYIEAMTGGSDMSFKVNQQLAQVAKKTDLAMAVGSQSLALKDPSVADSFKIVRKENPDGILLANLGADHPIENVRAAVDMIEANAIELHVNVAQELAMAEGDRGFYWLDNLATIIAKSPVPVIIKEVGFGMSVDSIKKIAQLEPAAINLGGANGTNFAQIEQSRDRQDENPLDLSFYGLSTVESLLAAQVADVQVPVIATGGLKSPRDVVTTLMLGAQTSSSAGFFLSQIMAGGPDQLEATIREWQAALPKLMLLLGKKRVADLKSAPHIFDLELQNYIQQIKKTS